MDPMDVLATLLGCLVATASASVSRSVKLPGEIVLGGLFPIHEKGEHAPCSPAFYDRGLQRLEAMLFAIDRINADPVLLPHIRLGVNILDTCSRDSYALNQSLEFIRASINTIDTSGFECSDGREPRRKYAHMPVANLLRLFGIPQISPASTAKTLSDKTRFDLFARTVPPDNYQAMALVDILLSFNWSYVSTVSSEGSYGEDGIEAFRQAAAERNICIAVNEKVPHNANDTIFNEIIQRLTRKPQAKGVILFTRAEDARGMLAAARRRNQTDSFYWLASDGWGIQQKLVEGLEDVAQGAVTLELDSSVLKEFDLYMLNRTPDNNFRNPRDLLIVGCSVRLSSSTLNPRFEDFWEQTFQCKLPRNLEKMAVNEIPVTAGPEAKPVKPCDPSLRLSPSNGYIQDSKVQFVVAAVYAFAHALENLYRDVCSRKERRVCQAMKTFDGSRFYRDYLLKVNFIGEMSLRSGFPRSKLRDLPRSEKILLGTLRKKLFPAKEISPQTKGDSISVLDNMAGSEVKFDASGDGPARYKIMNFQKMPRIPHFEYKEVGSWADGKLIMDPKEVVWKKGSRVFPSSVCSLPCGIGEVKYMQQGETCCWYCYRCQQWEFLADEFTCQDCGFGNWPHENKTGCYALTRQYMQWTSPFALIPIAISCAGILLTLAVIAVFVRYKETPLVRASGRELSFMLLAGILISYLNTFLLLAKPSPLFCGLQRFGIGTGFSIIYSALLTKTNRISRIFDSASKSARRPSFISPRSQLIITCSLISVQLLATVVWMIVEPPGTRDDFPDRMQAILKCRIKDLSFLVSLVYNMMLITTCTVYAVKTRKIPENFNESKFIGFTMYTTCIIWLAFVPIYFGTGNSFEIQTTTLCVAISLSASVCLVCLYSPKIYIIVFHPDKNVRKLTMNSATYKKAPSSTSQAATTAVTVLTSVNYGSCSDL
ncbi:unnamed protein product [Darwinula stevensoni]|uniref:G-protein coupled receptors family 3 profile domain-containing protein n=1 Tax=Darwinula stevensoni TaxID=69355 RepID=A0A7R8XKQ2_9CRUS|nr:unnamed protein product [Darwinula stevensoni]CAG0893388.1 unnamed protein product [Darwinula stevensoni]